MRSLARSRLPWAPATYPDTDIHKIVGQDIGIDVGLGVDASMIRVGERKVYYVKVQSSEFNYSLFCTYTHHIHTSHTHKQDSLYYLLLHSL